MVTKSRIWTRTILRHAPDLAEQVEKGKRSLALPYSDVRSQYERNRRSLSFAPMGAFAEKARNRPNSKLPETQGPARAHASLDASVSCPQRWRTAPRWH
jgi:hypothetical protein